MSNTYTFKCGCVFPVIGGVDGRPTIKFNPELKNIPLNCPKTWSLLATGRTKGVFQLESRLGQSLCGKLKPENIEQLAALAAIIRPGTMESIEEGKSITQHYIDRKNKLEDVHYFHPSLIPSLKATLGCMIYQEQLMQISKDVAGFNLQEAHLLMKAVGKKKPELMAKVKTEFLSKCSVTNILNEIEASQVFDWMEKSQRYLFNASHSFSYGLNGYLSAYAKAHFPKAFYTSYLFYAKEKQKPFEEIRELVSDARNNGIDIQGPDIRNLNDHFRIIDGKIYFGFADIKGIGTKAFDGVCNRISEVEKLLGKPIAEWTWLEALVFLIPQINSTAASNIIRTGGFAHFSVPRNRMEYESIVYSKISTTEQKKIERLFLLKEFDENGLVKPRYNFKTLEELLAFIVIQPTGKDGLCHTNKRLIKVGGLLDAIKKPPYELSDSPSWIQQEEKKLLGVAISCTSIEGVDIGTSNCTIREFHQGCRIQPMIISCQIDRVKVVKTKKGKNPGQEMCFLEVSDISGTLDGVVVFPQQYEEFKGYFFEENTVLIIGKRENNGFLVEKIQQL